MIHTFTIHASKWDKLEEKLNKILRKSEKHNVGKVSWTTEKPRIHKNKHGVWKLMDVTLDIEPVKIEGWNILARIDHDLHKEHDDGRNVVHSWGELPTHYHTAKGNCDHCNHNRRRKSTTIIENAEGEYRQIGRNCLALYIGVTGDFLSSWFAVNEGMLGKFQEEHVPFDDEEDLYWGETSNLPVGEDTEPYLATVVSMIDEYGWHNSGAMSPTWESALALVIQMRKEPRNEDIRPTLEQMNKAKDALEWMRGLFTEEDGDFKPSDEVDASNYNYFWNLNTYASREYISNRDLPTLASGIFAYNRRLADLIKREESSSEWISEVGERPMLHLQLVDVRTTTSYVRGVGDMPKWIYLFQDADGNNMTWFSSKDKDLEVESWYGGKGKITKHTIFNNEKVTYFNRFQCKESDAPEA